MVAALTAVVRCYHLCGLPRSHRRSVFVGRNYMVVFMKYTTRAQNNLNRELLIEAIEKNGTFGERIWLPLLRFVHKRELRKEVALYAPRR